MKSAHYRITIYTNKETITVTDPITCHFNIVRAVLVDAIKANVEITNLAPTTRKSIFQDMFTTDESQWKYITIEAGYNEQLALIFKGRILEAYSHKSGGSTDIITEIQAQALDIVDNPCSFTFKAGTTKLEAFQQVVAAMPNLTIGNVGALEGTFQTDTTYDGNAIDVLTELTDGNAQIDNNMVNCLLTNEVIDVPVPVISSDVALLETPRRREANLDIKMLFCPSLQVGQLLEINSNVQTEFNGQYKVIGITHDCTISGTQAGTRTTTVNLYIGVFLPNASIEENGKIKPNFNKVKGIQNISSVNSNNNQDWIYPCNGRISSPFGKRQKPMENASTYHSGIDIAVPIGTPIKAIADGTISAARSGMRGYGVGVFINHGIVNGNGIVSEYGHLSRFIVKIGQKVKQGQIIAYSGNSGTSTGPHLHLTIRQNGTAVNPVQFLKKV